MGLNATHSQAVKVYPVPASDYLILSRENAQSEILTIRDITGKLVKSILSGQRETRIDVRDLHPGIYFYSIIAKSEDRDKDFKMVRKMLLLK